MAMIFDYLKRSDMLVTLDIETVDVRSLGGKARKDKSFPAPIDCKIVALSMSAATVRHISGDPALELIKLGTIDGDETTVLQTFVSFINKHKPLIVGFYSSKFDLEVIKLRCLVHGIAFPVWFQEGSKWDSYRSRYSVNWSLDILDFLTSFGASKMFKLDTVARAVGLPGKFGIDGSAVAGLFEAGQIAEIKAYCETDVLTTYGLLLRVLHLTGDLSTAGFQNSARMWLDHLGTLERDRPEIAKYKKQIDLERYINVQASIEEQVCAVGCERTTPQQLQSTMQ